jgi:hypothetical protein
MKPSYSKKRHGRARKGKAPKKNKERSIYLDIEEQK